MTTSEGETWRGGDWTHTKFLDGKCWPIYEDSGGRWVAVFDSESERDQAIADHNEASALRQQLALANELAYEHDALRAALTEAQAALKRAQGKVHYLQHNATYGTAETCAVPECAALHTPTGAGTTEAN